MHAAADFQWASAAGRQSRHEHSLTGADVCSEDAAVHDADTKAADNAESRQVLLQAVHDSCSAVQDQARTSSFVLLHEPRKTLCSVMTIAVRIVQLSQNGKTRGQVAQLAMSG